MNRPTPLPWVKAWTSSMTDFDWLALPLEVRAVFQEIVKLGGVGWPRGTVNGTDESIAAGIRADASVVTRAIDCLVAKPNRSLKRTAGGIKIVKWEKYQAPAMAISHAQRGEQPHREKRESREEGEQRYSFLREFPEWYERFGDARALDRLAAKNPALDFEEEFREFMAYADRRAGEGKAWVDYPSALRNRLKGQVEYHKKRGWTQLDNVIDLPDLSRQPARMG